MSSKLTIKEEMRAIDERDYGWWNSLTAEEQKKLGLWVLMRFVSSVSSSTPGIKEHYLTMTNELANVNFQVFKNHPELQHRLLQLVGIGVTQVHPWVAPPKKRRGTNINSDLMNHLLLLNPQLNDTEIGIIVENTPKEELVIMLEESGFAAKKIKEMLK
jgi:hypothetical protein